MMPEPESPETEATVEEAADAVTSDVDSLIEKLIDERDSLRDQMLRTSADLQNFRKRVQQERTQLRQGAIEGFVVDLLPVLDNFERTKIALQSGATLESLLEGVNAIERQLKGALEQHKVSRIVSEGEAFDPGLHEAIETVGEAGASPVVTEELQAGYRLADKVIRPARVRVSSS